MPVITFTFVIDLISSKAAFFSSSFSDKANNRNNATAADEYEDEFMIAVDLNLYSNPLHEALHLHDHEMEGLEKGPKHKISEEHHDEEHVAADLTKYHCPMHHLDKKRIEKKKAGDDDDEEEEEEQKK